MRFYNYLLEKDMPIDQALKIFDLNYKALGNKILIKKRYRELAKKHHPDHTGDTGMMQRINLAYEVLKNPEDWITKFTDKVEKGQAKTNLYKDLMKAGIFKGSKVGVYA